MENKPKLTFNPAHNISSEDEIGSYVGSWGASPALKNVTVGLSTSDSGNYYMTLPSTPVQHGSQTVSTELGTVTAEWKEIASSVPDWMRIQCGSFINTCRELGVFESVSDCDVGMLEDGHVIFDWNTGNLPMFTVIFWTDRRIVYAATFGNGDRISSNDADMASLREPLARMIREKGQKS